MKICDSSGDEVQIMPFIVMLSPDAQKYLDSLDKKHIKNIKKHLKELEKGPFKPRAGCDIDIIGGSGRPPMYRLRIGNFRAVYFVDGNTVYITDLFPKKRDSAYREN
ncbi:ParE toxin of type II toxin-antitoxin system, parDE [uncultured archaeon]|nr:ParE toxin of type II toxin-antitoxin system, parDE [uncultured archaeon]